MGDGGTSTATVILSRELSRELRAGKAMAG